MNQEAASLYSTSAFRSRPEAVSGFASKQAGETKPWSLFRPVVLWALRHFELDFLTLFEGLEAIALDGAIVNKDVGRARLLNKAIASSVKPLDLTGYSRNNERILLNVKRGRKVAQLQSGNLRNAVEFVLLTPTG